MTPALLFVCMVMVPVLVGDPAARLLASDMRQAIANASRSLQGTAIDLDIPLNKLSDQLNGKTPFTYCWRLLTLPDVKVAFFDIQAHRVEAVFVRVGELRDLVGGVRALVDAVPKKRMAKMLAPRPERKVQAV